MTGWRSEPFWRSGSCRYPSHMNPENISLVISLWQCFFIFWLMLRDGVLQLVSLTHLKYLTIYSLYPSLLLALTLPGYSNLTKQAILPVQSKSFWFANSSSVKAAWAPVAYCMALLRFLWQAIYFSVIAQIKPSPVWSTPNLWYYIYWIDSVWYWATMRAPEFELSCQWSGLLPPGLWEYFKKRVINKLSATRAIGSSFI